MLHGAHPARFVLTLLLAIAVPFCCCDLQSLLGGCSACVPTGSSSSVPPRDGDQFAHHSCCHGRATQKHDDSSTPAKHPEEHDCKCEKSTGKMVPVQKSLELAPPVLIAVLDWSPTAVRNPAEVAGGPAADARAVQRPPTSLLRMHCALTV